MPRGIFRLGQVYADQLSNNWSTKSDVWIIEGSPYRQAHPYGYWVGGYTSPDRSTIDRVDFLNDEATALTRANLSLPKRSVATIANVDYGYAVGGISGNTAPYPYYSAVERLALANDTVTPLIRGPVNNPNNAMRASGNKNYGWIVGGNEGSGSISRVDRIDYSNDTATASARTNLPDEMSSQGATGTQDYGYHGSGYVSVPVPYITTLYRIDYANDTTITTKGPLLTARWGSAATGNASYGWWGAGYTGSNTSNTDRIDYASDTSTATPKGNVHSTRVLGASGNQNYGYWGGGGAPATSTVTRLQYANDTSDAVTKGPLTQARYNINAFGALENNITTGTIFPSVFNSDWQYGYWIGGYPAQTTVERVDYSNDLNRPTFRGNLTVGRLDITATGNSDYSWTGGGYNPSSTYMSFVDRIAYANDTATSSTRGALTQNKGTAGGVGNQNYGYFGGGYKPASPNQISDVDRIAYSNDTITASPKGKLSQARQVIGATGNLNYGWFGGGNIPAQSSTVDRIDYSNDTATASPRTNLTHGRYDVYAAGNENYGWWAGGYSPPSYLSYVERVDWANDTTQASVRGPLTTNKNSAAGASNSSYGWFGGGYFPAYRSDIDRIDFSNDTATASPRAALNSNKNSMAASSAKSNTITKLSQLPSSEPLRYSDYQATYPYGYWGGGYPPGPITTVSRIDYSSDSVNATPKGNLTAGRYNFSGMMNNGNFGYMGGGYYPSNYTDIHRLDFSNDTLTMLVVSNVSSYRRRGQHSSIGNKDFGYFTGGSDNASARYSTVDRLDFSNDTATAAPKGPLGEGKAHLVGTGNQNFGYAMGGSPAVSTIRRIDFSNDTVTASNRGPLVSTRYGAGATGTRDFGYIMGGYWPGASSRTERITYANDTTTSTGNLSRTQGYGAAVGNSTFGYVTGGNSNIERLDFSNDTALGSSRGQTQLGTASGVFGVSSQNNALAQPPSPINSISSSLGIRTVGQQYGYVAGGDYGPDVSTVERIDYINDTIGTSVRTPLPESHYGASFVGNINNGYYGGGFTPGPTAKSSVFRVSYSNDTSVLAVGPLATTQGFFGSQAAGNNSYGYFAGGYSNSSLVMRIDYSSDNSTASPKGPLAASRYGMAATGNSDYGYWSGGIPGPVSTVQRIDYSNDTATSSPKGPLSLTRRYAAATGNSDYGWIGGGNIPSPIAAYSTVDRIDYSNDTAAAVAKGPLTQARYQLTATGNKSYGYWFGGYYPSSYSTIDRVDYSNDTATAKGKGHITQARYDLVSASASANGLPQG